MNEQRLQPLRSAARALGVPTTWLSGEADSGRVPCLRAGSRYLFNVAAVERALLERAGPAGTKGRRPDGCVDAGPDNDAREKGA